MPKRLLIYLLLIALTIVVPYVATMICIAVTGNRYDGMGIAIIPGIILVHIIFGIVVIKLHWLKKIVWSLVMSVIIFVLVILMVSLNLIKTHLDIYSFWDLVISNLIAGLVCWELFFQIHQRLSKNIKSGK